MPLFSTIIAVYNRHELIVRTLESVLDQSVDDHEVIVVDDGSTDDTPNTLDRFSDRITVIRQDNAGPGVARNRGIEAAQGQYITLIDSDDLWFPWTLSAYRKAIKEFDEPSFVASVEWDFHHESDLTIVREQAYEAVAYPDYFASYADQRWVPLCGVAVRADAMREAGGFAADRANYEESDLWLRLGCAPGFVRINRPTCSARRKHPGMVTHDLARSVAGVERLINNERSGVYPGGSARHRQRIAMLTRHVRSLCAQCIKQGDKQAAKHLYRMTLGWHMKLGRLKFLLGLPWMAITSSSKGDSAS